MTSSIVVSDHMVRKEMPGSNMCDIKSTINKWSESKHDHHEAGDKKSNVVTLSHLPNEMVLQVFRWTNFEGREALRDVCRRFRHLIDENEISISLEFMTYARRQSLNPMTFTKFFNLRKLDLCRISKTSMRSVMSDTRQRNQFAMQMSIECPAIEEMKVQAIQGCKWLVMYAKHMKDCKVRKLSIDMGNGYMGCVTALVQVAPFLKRLTNLSLHCHSIRRSDRFHHLTESLFQALGPRLTFLSCDFPKHSHEIDEISVNHLSELELFCAGTLTTNQLEQIRDRSPNIRTLRTGVTTDSVCCISQLKNLQHLSLSVQSPIPNLLLTTTLKSLSHLRVLELGFKAGLGESLIYAIAVCKRVEVLILTGCMTLSADLLIQSMRHMQKMRKLFAHRCYLSGASVITSSGSPPVLNEVSECCPLLQQVILANCHFVRRGSAFQRQPINEWTSFQTEKYFAV